MQTTIKKNTPIKNNIEQIKDFAKNIIPMNKNELYVFLFFTFFYLSYSIFILFNSHIADYPSGYADLYFSFDNASIFQKGYDNISRHPLMPYLTRPFMSFGVISSLHCGYKFRSVVYITICTILIALAIMYIFRYLKRVIKLEGLPLYLITLLYGFFTTNMFLCFTTETYTISLFLLSLSVCYYSCCITEKKNVTFSINSFFILMLGGVTITNIVKGGIPILFTKEDFKLKILKIVLCGILFLGAMALADHHYHIFSHYSTKVGYTEDTIPESGTYFEKTFDHFYGAQILMPKMHVEQSDFFKKWATELPGYIVFDFYHHWWQYAVCCIIILCMIAAIVLNYKNKLIWLLASLLSVDILLHIILKFGISSSFIYGGHWIYVVPLLLGWLYKSLNTNGKKIYLIILSCIFVIVLINNSINMVSFIDIAIDYTKNTRIPEWHEYLKIK